MGAAGSVPMKMCRECELAESLLAPGVLRSFGLDMETSFHISQLFTELSKSAGRGRVVGRAGGDLGD